MAMKGASLNLRAKRAVGESAAELVRNGMIVGLGTGSTIAWTIKMLGEKVKDNCLDFLGVPTSYQAESLAIASGIKLTTLSQHPALDLAIDGADQIDEMLFAIKGGGAAHTREKVVACSAKKFVIVADESKYVKRLNQSVPIEVLPFAAPFVEKQLRDLGGVPLLREGKMKDGPVITDNGNFVIDAYFGEIVEPNGINAKLCYIPGIVGHGIFDNINELYLASAGEIEVLKRKR